MILISENIILNDKLSYYNEKSTFLKKTNFTIKYIYNKVSDSKSPENGMHRFEQPLLHQLCSDFHDLGLIQRINEIPFWKCICLAIFLQILDELLRNNTLHKSRDPVNIDQTVFMTEIHTE